MQTILKIRDFEKGKVYGDRLEITLHKNVMHVVMYQENVFVKLTQYGKIMKLLHWKYDSG